MTKSNTSKGDAGKSFASIHIYRASPRPRANRARDRPPLPIERGSRIPPSLRTDHPLRIMAASHIGATAPPAPLFRERMKDWNTYLQLYVR